MNKIGSSVFLKHLLALKNAKLWISASRTMLSEAYLCEDAWKKRLTSPTLSNIKLDQYFVETDKKFGTKQLVSGIDLDLFANCVQDESQLDELEHLLYRFRRTKRAVEIMDSTIYAVIRVFLKFQQYESLFRILNDRENYGIFPDMYSYNILMSTFLKEKMYKEAVNIAILMMLQENFENKLSCLLGLHSCQIFLDECTLESLKEEEVVEESKEEDDDEEETLVRVPFLRNPSFDDHFEITNPKHLIGKTLYLIGRELKNPLGRSYQLVGLAMYDKWEKAANLLKSFVESEDLTLISDVVERVKIQIDTMPDDENNFKKSLGDQFDKYFEEMKSKGKLIEGRLPSVLLEALKDIPQLEKEDVESQTKIFDEWEQQRKFAIDEQNRELDKQKRLQIIEEKKEYLFWKEKLLFFFENEEKNVEELKKVEEMMAKMEHKSSVKDTYFPPEIERKAPESLTRYQRLARVKKI